VLRPLKQGGYGLGRIARCGSDTTMVYVFGSRHFSTPEPAYLRGLRPSSAVDVMFVDDEGLKKGDWQILGQADGWRRDEWAPPLFSFALDQITWSEIREYPDGDPFGVTRSRRTPRDEARQYPGDGIQCRAGAEFEFDLWALPNNEAIQSWAISFGDGMSKSRPEDHAAYNAPADGDWFALRLDQGGWGLGRVARTDGFLMVAYLFKRRFEAVPELTRIQLPSAADAILAQRTNLEISPL